LFSGLLYGSVNNEASEYQYKIKANTAGIFTVPPIYAQAMYEPTIEAYSGAGLRRWNKMICVKKGWLGLSFMLRQTHSERNPILYMAMILFPRRSVGTRN